MDRNAFDDRITWLEERFARRIAAALNEFAESVDELTEGLELHRATTGASDTHVEAGEQLPEVPDDKQPFPVSDYNATATLLEFHDIINEQFPDHPATAGLIDKLADNKHLGVSDDVLTATDLEQFRPTDNWHHHHDDEFTVHYHTHRPDKHKTTDDTPCNHAGCPWYLVNDPGISAGRIVNIVNDPSPFDPAIFDPATGHRHYFGLPCDTDPCPLNQPDG